MQKNLKHSKWLELVLALSFSVFTVACSPQGSPAASEMSSQALDNLGCSSLQSATFDELYKISEFQKTWPTSKELEASLKEKWKSDSRFKKIKSEKVEEFFRQYSLVVETIKSRLPSNWSSMTREERLAFIASVELGATLTEENKRTKEAFSANWQKVEAAQSALRSFCAVPSVPEDSDEGSSDSSGGSSSAGDLKSLKNDYPAFYGSHKVFATAYQGCSSLELEPMNDRTPALQGVAVIGNHPAGGLKRAITDLNLAYKTHYYISRQQPDTKCQDLSRTPLIYDFGGKPYATSSDQSKLNFFVDSGSGTSVLGVDCGGYVFSAMMAAGLRFVKNTPLKAVQIYYISANMNPANNYNCFSPVLVNNQFRLEAGDLVSTPGHILMIDQVGDDPFGLDAITKVSDCYDGKINVNNFNFVISQSSPSKGAIGINRILASTYLKESPSYRQGFMNYAVAACKARFGVTVNVDRTNFWWLRHSKTPECRQPEIALEKQECAASCF